MSVIGLLREYGERRDFGTIRPYRTSDFETVIQLWWTSWHSSSGYKHHRPIADWKRRWRDLEHTHTIAVVEHRGNIIAFVALNAQTCLLSQLFVSPLWKRKGIGKQLIRWAASHCPKGFKLETAADNRESRAFYEALGLVEIARSINDFNGREQVEYSTRQP